ncbi:MAG: cysteine desulfurase family protein [Acidimicrobiales bacterium]
MSRHYLDHASTSPTRPEAVAAMSEWLGRSAADPGRVHTEGRLARAAVEEAREQVAALFGARPREVVFTSGATESIAMAVWGATEDRDHLVCPEVEHSAVRESSARHEVSWVGVDGKGRVDPAEVMSTVQPGRTALVHIQSANHEVGTRQPVAEVVAPCREAGVLVHVDAAAGAGLDRVDFGSLGADLMSVSAHKLGGPPGVGALLVRRGLRMRPLLVGGEQERARRAGMENVAAIAGFGAAAAVLLGVRDEEGRRCLEQTGRLLQHAQEVPGVVAFGATDAEERLAHLVCVGVGGVEAEAVLLGLDQAGIAAHSGSACSSESLEPSPVLAAMGVEAERSLRLSVGWSTTDEDVEAFGRAFSGVVSRLRALGPGPS